MKWAYLDLDREVVEAVIAAKDGRIGVCIDICLEMSNGIQTPVEREEVRQKSSESERGQVTEEEGLRELEETTDLLGIEGDEGIGRVNLADKIGEGRGSSEAVDLMS